MIFFVYDKERPALFNFPISASITEIIFNNNAIFAKFNNNKKDVKRDHYVLSHIQDNLRIFTFILLSNNH